jgi:hypothetical protein
LAQVVLLGLTFLGTLGLLRLSEQFIMPMVVLVVVVVTNLASVV